MFILLILSKIWSANSYFFTLVLYRIIYTIFTRTNFVSLSNMNCSQYQTEISIFAHDKVKKSSYISMQELRNVRCTELLCYCMTGDWLTNWLNVESQHLASVHSNKHLDTGFQLCLSFRHTTCKGNLSITIIIIIKLDYMLTYYPQ
jgi:hypothetical protein